MQRRKLGCLAAFILLTSSLATGQTFLNEDFSSAVATTAPAGWVTTMTGGSPSPWRFDNIGSRPLDPPISGPFAMCDSDITGSGTTGTSRLESPAMNVTGATLLNLTFDQQLRDLTSGWSIDVFDGTVWNTVASQANNLTTSVNIGYNSPNASTVVSTIYNITAAAGGAANAKLRFDYAYGWDWWWAIDNVRIEQPLPDNMAVISIDSPVDDPNSCLPLSGIFNLTATLQNQGSNTITSGSIIQVDFTVNGNSLTTEFILLAANLNPGDTIQHTFAGQMLLLAPGPNTTTVTVSYPGDADPFNDSVSEIYAGLSGAGTVSAFPYVQDFDSLGAGTSTTAPVAWMQSTTDGTGTNSDWFFTNTTTPSTLTGPSGDHTSGSGTYAFIEDAGNFTQVNLISPCFDFSTVPAPQLNFWMHSQNGTNPSTTSENFFSVDVVSYPGGAVTTSVLGPIGHQGSSWTPFTVNLSAFAGTTVQLIFRGQSSGGGVDHDIAIDDVVVYDLMPTPGQAPQPGLAVLDINNSRNGNAQAIAIGAGGPYFSTMTVGGSMAISIAGEPNAPIAFLAGPLTPVAASYPNVGQLDIGGTVNPSTGVPGSIIVIADGFSPLTFTNAIFNTGPNGTLNLVFQVPNFPVGPFAAFQAVLATGNGFFFAITNAVSMSVQ